MTRSFFQRLDEHAVDWLLVSGQASILYGAATFSEDVDLWVDPAEENLKRCAQALRAVGARYYKLTPPFDCEFVLRQHRTRGWQPAVDLSAHGSAAAASRQPASLHHQHEQCSASF